MGIENMRTYRHPNVLRAIKNKEIYLDPETHTFWRTEPGINVVSPWVMEHTGNEPCVWCFKVLWGLFGLLPSPALDCYKIVVRPRTIIELMALNKLQVDMGLSCKCGCELREEVNANYGGYFYTRSLDEGLSVKKLVKDHVGKVISPDIPVFLKRGCTEIEHRYGPSDKWQMQPGQEELEKKLESLFDDSFRRSGTQQPQGLKKEIIESWMYFAHSRGDMSYLEFTKGRLLYPSYVTY